MTSTCGDGRSRGRCFLLLGNVPLSPTNDLVTVGRRIISSNSRKALRSPSLIATGIRGDSGDSGWGGRWANCRLNSSGRGSSWAGESRTGRSRAGDSRTGRSRAGTRRCRRKGAFLRASNRNRDRGCASITSTTQIPILTVPISVIRTRHTMTT